MMVTFFLGVRDNLGFSTDLDRHDLISVLTESAQELRDPSQKLDAIMLSVASYRAGTTRAKANAICAEAMAMDVDEGWQIEDAEAAVRQLGLAHVIHTTTKCTEQGHRFRILLFLDRPVSATEYDALWLAVADRFGVAMDRSTRDISRLSVMPATWSGALNLFSADADGGLIRVDELLATSAHNASPPLIPDRSTVNPVTSHRKTVFFDPLAEHRNELRRLRNRTARPENLTDLYESPIVPRHSLETALSAQLGGRTFRLLCSVAASARKQGYDVDQCDLAEIAQQFSVRVGRRTTDRELLRDAARALAWSETLEI